MPPTVEELRPHLQSFDFRNLFVEGLGWNHHHGEPVHLVVNGHDYVLQPLTEKAGFVVYLCEPDADGIVPRYPVRRKIEHQIAKLSFEHMIVFVDGAKTIQVWQWIKRELGKPVACREYAFSAGHGGDPLLQRLRTLAITLDEEEGLTIGAFAWRVRQAMDVERLTKRFYERFKKELAAFRKFIEGIAAQDAREWYASLMLNRMMFIYFVQKQGFLDGDPDYLRNRLAMVQRQQCHNGSGRFHQFYRLFLRRLFHEGLGQPEAQRASDLAALLGKVPFLNGGLFEVHDLEHDNPEISIPDEAFEKVFAFFDDYRWHLDERPDREDNEINPDVLGYIFEKYVNQKQMGAYYTKEDITGYISRNTVIPFLFDAARKQCPVAFQPGGGVWRLLQDDPDRYIYPAVGHGIAWKYSPDAEPERLERGNELPDDIAAGVDDVSRRDGWNRPAPEVYALPTETWREVVARRQRYADVRAKLASGAVHHIDDLVTLNLDVERFAMDVVVQSEGPVLLRAFWHAVRDVSVLDPTCGSGAFLFAALNILEPLYSACIEGMSGFLDDLNRTKRPHSPRALQDFRDVIAQVGRHPSVRYFVLKSIVLNNLYGVDIMEEAVEICKLRLFLKLVAQLERYDQIEPLPDIDFNIRAGNTLVGFTSLDAVRRAITMEPDGQHRALYEEDHATLEDINESAEIASRAFDQFRQQQTALGGEVTAAHKTNLRSRMNALESKLNRFLAVEYRIKPEDSSAFAAWRDSHQPFHWFVEFYGIMIKGGFDVVIGNPPYVAKHKIAKSYRFKGFSTDGCPDIYAPVLEQSIRIAHDNGRVSMIVPLSLTFSSRFAPLRTLMYRECSAAWFSSFGRIPSALFSFDTRVRNTIFLAQKSTLPTSSFFTTRLHRWFDSERATLFEGLYYSQFLPSSFGGLVPKIGNSRILSMFESLLENDDYRLSNEFVVTGNGGYAMHFKQTAYNWLTFCVAKPPAYGPHNRRVRQTKYGSVQFIKEEHRDLSLFVANGLIMFTWWIAVGDDFDVTKSNFSSAPFGPSKLSEEQKGLVLSNLPDLETAMDRNLVFKLNAGINIGNYNLARCRDITDKSDKILLDGIGFRDLWEDFQLEHALVVRTSFETKDKVS